MESLAFWKEKGLSTSKEGESRYQQILADKDLVPFGDLDDKLREFISEFSMKHPGHIVTSDVDANPVDASYSRLGVLIYFDNDAPNTVVPDAFGIAGPLGLTMFDPVMRLVMGKDDSVEITIKEE